ncbi:MAG TPA: SH3 domain-containing protein [Aggregatilineaceae bacterium]|nr:SH3 domain-containing protein [Aggregatilineaceae bacterium]
MRASKRLAGGLAFGLALALAGCNFGGEDPAPVVVSSTPVAWATHAADLPPGDTPAPTLDLSPPAPSPTPLALPSLTPAPTLTAPPATLPDTPSPLLPTTATAPTQAPRVTVAPTVTRTPFAFPSPRPSATPRPPDTATPVAVAARVCPTCSMLRLRGTPGTAGEVLTLLAAEAPLQLVGRTADNRWVQAVTVDGAQGWVAASYLDEGIDFGALAVTGSAVDEVPSPDNPGAVAGVTSTARQIFLDGRAKGNIPFAFTKVGDSITAAPQFLTPFGSGTYRLGEYETLRGAISFFSGPNGRGANPFAASSMAARNSWGADSVLNPTFADPNLCRAGETPLECEYRVVKPAVALIMVGTNDSGGIPVAEFRANLDRIVRISIQMGVIPVLSTIPPKQYNPATDGRVAEFNQVIVSLAQAYDVPLWNYWQTMTALPNNGLDPDGVHPSTPPDGGTGVFDAEHLRYGYTARNLGALQVLYTLWQQVLYDGDQAPAVIAPDLPAPQTPAVTGCAGAPAPRLRAGATGQVTPGLPNKVRSAPASSAPQVGSIPGEGVFTVLSGPTCADGYHWWQVLYEGIVGWTAEGSAAEYWVAPVG